MIIDGRQWSIVTFTNELGEICAGERIPHPDGPQGQGLTCRDPQTLFNGSPLVYFTGGIRSSPQSPSFDNTWVWGWASPDISRLTLQLTSCRQIPLVPDSDHIFFHVFSRSEVSHGIGPSRLLAYGATGNALEAAPAGAPKTGQIPSAC
jgi:hypothetical protein